MTLPPTPTRSAITRQYRGASIAITTGSLALGALVVDRLAFALRDNLATFYGVGVDTVDSLGAVSGSNLNIGELTATSLALLTAITFVMTERRRLRHLQDTARRISRRNRLRVVERLRARDWVDMLVTRSSVYSAVLMGVYVFDASFERFDSGLGFGLGLTEWRTVLPLASVYGLCVIAALVTASISMFGMRVLTSLKQLTVALVSLAKRIAVLPRPDLTTPVLGFAKLLGMTLLSRPPPSAALA